MAKADRHSYLKSDPGGNTRYFSSIAALDLPARSRTMFGVKRDVSIFQVTMSCEKEYLSG